MLDIGWSEMLLIIAVMIIVIGPKELPRALYTLGQWVGKVRLVARQFQDSIEQMAHQTGIDEVRKEVQKLTDVNIESEVEKAVDPEGDLGKAFDIQPPDFNAPALEKPDVKSVTAENSDVKSAAAEKKDGDANGARADADKGKAP